MYSNESEHKIHSQITCRCSCRGKYQNNDANADQLVFTFHFLQLHTCTNTHTHTDLSALKSPKDKLEWSITNENTQCDSQTHKRTSTTHTHARATPSNLLSPDDEWRVWQILPQTMLPIFSLRGFKILTDSFLNFQFIILDTDHSTGRAEHKGQIHSHTCTDTNAWKDTNMYTPSPGCRQGAQTADADTWIRLPATSQRERQITLGNLGHLRWTGRSDHVHLTIRVNKAAGMEHLNIWLTVHESSVATRVSCSDWSPLSFNEMFYLDGVLSPGD